MKRTVWIAALCIFAMYCFAQSDSSSSANGKDEQSAFSIHGYLKNLNGLMLYPDEESMQWGVFHNRINMRWISGSRISAALEVRNRILYGEAVKLNAYPSAFLDADRGIVDLTFLPFDTRSAKMVSSVERLWTRIDLEKFEVIAGRQRINWGVNLAWNPNDIFNTYSFMDFDYEERPGSDAVKLRIPIAEMSSVEFAYKAGKQKGDDVYAGLYKFNYANFDYQFLGGVYEGDIIAGAGWAGSIGNIGFKGEGSYFHPTETPADTSGMAAASVEFDYTINGILYINTSYLFNSSGLRSVSAVTQDILNSGMLLSPKSLSPSRHSVFLQINSISSPLFTAGISFIYFFEINGMYLFPSATYSINDKWEIAAFLQSFWLKNNTMHSEIQNAVMRIKFSF